MRTLLFVLAALVCLGAQDALAQQQGVVTCSQQASVALPAGTQTQVVPAAATGTARIYVCGFIVSAVAASVVTFQQGTGSNCATGSTATGTTIQLGATSTFAMSSAAFSGWQIPNPNALCATASTAANIQIFYTLQ